MYLCIYNLYNMKDLHRLTLRDELGRLTLRRENNLTVNAIASLLSTERNFSVHNMMEYLTACEKQLEITDWMGETWRATNTQDLHDMIGKLFDKSRRRLSDMNNTIQVTYTSKALSIDTLLKVLEYFKCKLDIINI